MNFHHSRGGVLKIGPEALAIMRSYEQHAPDALEAGGLMFGRYLLDGFNLVVDVVTEPMSGDERTRHGFNRQDDGHQRRSDELWESSKHTCVHLGNWHTHAEPFPSPSPVDLESWRSSLVREVQPDEAVFWVIVGQVEVRVWEGVKSTGEIQRCKVRA